MLFRTRPIYVQLDYGRVRCILDEYLTQKDLTRRDLARQTGLRMDSIQKLCRNTAKQYPIDQLIRICSALDCRITDLLIYDPPSGSIADNLRQIADIYEKIEQDHILARRLAMEEQTFQQLLDEFEASSALSENRS